VWRPASTVWRVKGCSDSSGSKHRELFHIEFFVFFGFWSAQPEFSRATRTPGVASRSRTRSPERTCSSRQNFAASSGGCRHPYAWLSLSLAA